jgi:hypothetical protein
MQAIDVPPHPVVTELTGPSSIRAVRKSYPPATRPEARCGALSPSVKLDVLVYVCDRPQGHTGPHVAYGVWESRNPLAWWEG